MDVVSFFSYKGGVGRSLAVNQVAERLSEYGLSSLVIDFDLEAPGMRYKFEKDLKKIEPVQGVKKGLVDYIHTFLVDNDKKKLPDNFEEYYYTLPKEDKRKAQIWLMPAGDLTSNYWDKLGDIDWKKDFLLRGDRMGSMLLVDLKERIRKDLNPDYILIDSRTGISDITTLTLRLMADKIVVMAVNNPENLDGSETILRTMLAPENQWNNKAKELFFALSRFPIPSNDYKTSLKKSITTAIRKKFVPTLIKTENFTILHEDLELAWGEKDISNSLESEHWPLKEDYANLFNIITKDNSIIPESVRIKIGGKQKVREVLAKTFKLYEQDCLEEAIHVINEIPETYRDFLFYNLRSVIRNKLTQFEDAIKDCEEALKSNSYDINSILNWGIYLGNLAASKNDDEKLYRQAFAKYQSAASLLPNHAQIYFNWGTHLGKLAESKNNNEEMYQEVFKLYQKALDINPNYAEVYYNWGTYLGKLATDKNNDESLFELAFSKYQNAINIKPENADAYFNWANDLTRLAKSKNSDEHLFLTAFDKYQKVTVIKPDHNDVYVGWGNSLLLLAASKNANKVLLKQSIEKLLEAEKRKTGSGSYDLACAYSLLKENANALQYLDLGLQFKNVTIAHIEKDSDMDNIRHLPEFKRILDKYRIQEKKSKK